MNVGDLVRFKGLHFDNNIRISSFEWHGIITNLIETRNNLNVVGVLFPGLGKRNCVRGDAFTVIRM